jgi:hypothetical protein
MDLDPSETDGFGRSLLIDGCQGSKACTEEAVAKTYQPTTQKL